MKIKQLVAKAVIAGGIGLPIVGLSTGVANADPAPRPPTPRPVPASAMTKPATALANGNRVAPTTTATGFTTRRPAASALTRVVPTSTGTQFTSLGTSASAVDTAASAETAPATIGNVGSPTTRATPFGSPQGRSDAPMTGLNPHGREGPAGLNPRGRAGPESPDSLGLGRLRGLLGRLL